MKRWVLKIEIETDDSVTADEVRAVAKHIVGDAESRVDDELCVGADVILDDVVGPL